MSKNSKDNKIFSTMGASNHSTRERQKEDYNMELEIIKKYEPKLYNACLNIFGESYKYHDAYIKFRGEEE